MPLNSKHIYKLLFEKRTKIPLLCPIDLWTNFNKQADFFCHGLVNSKQGWKNILFCVLLKLVAFRYKIHPYISICIFKVLVMTVSNLQFCIQTFQACNQVHKSKKKKLSQIVPVCRLLWSSHATQCTQSYSYQCAFEDW